MTIQVRNSSQTIGWFKDRLLEERLEFKPPFQRNPVWLDKHKAYLADTVMRNLPIPEVYIQKETDPEGRHTFFVVDGQQRLRALLEFTRGNVELMESYTPGRDGQVWDNLTETEKIAFWNYELIVREVTGASDTELRDLFRRLNQHTVVLNAQEIRNARYKGDFITTVSELADQAFWAEKRIVTPNEIRRMLDIEFMAELLVGIMHGPQNKKLSLDGFFSAYETGIPDKQSWLQRFETARALTASLVPDIEDTRWRGKSDYYSLFLAVDELASTGAVLRKRTKAIAALREFAEDVSERLSKTATGRARKVVREYVTAVEKAASDKDRRQARHEVLISILDPYFS